MLCSFCPGKCWHLTAVCVLNLALLPSHSPVFLKKKISGDPNGVTVLTHGILKVVT